MGTDATVRSSSGAALRMADTLLRALGGRAVALRVRTEPATGDGGQLGQAGAVFQDYTLAPVVFRKLRATLTAGEPNKYELLISATAVTNLVVLLAAASAEAMFNSAVGVVVDGQVRLVLAIGSSEAFGAAYLYRLVLRDQ
jgi:hypothetical protein